MRQIILFFTLALIHLTKLNAQTSFSCTHREYCYWDESLKNYQNCKGFEEKSLFVVSKDEKMFTHEIENMKATYVIDERVYDKENDIWTYQVTAEDNKKYTYFFDPRNKEIRFVPRKNEKTVMQSFDVKSVF